MQVDSPTYRKIAIDIAGKIKEGVYKEGEVLNGRSALSAIYNVSPETIRRSAMLLEDMKILRSIKGKGYVIESVENAQVFINRNTSIGNVNKQKYLISNLLKEKKAINEKLSIAIDELIDYAAKFKESNEIIPLEFNIPDDCKYIGKSIAEINFWQNTGGTVIGVKRDGKLILSPGPYLLISKSDILLVIGEHEVMHSVPEFLNIK